MTDEQPTVQLIGGPWAGRTIPDLIVRGDGHIDIIECRRGSGREVPLTAQAFGRLVRDRRTV